MRTGHDDGAEKRRPGRDWSNRRAEQIHAGVAVMSVERGGRAAKLAKRATRIVYSTHEKAPVRRAIATGKDIFRRRDQRDDVLECGHIRIAAGLAEDEPGRRAIRR